jgi:hypothetical protein
MVGRPRANASSPASGSKAKPQTTGKSAILTASLAARMSSGLKVPNSGPMATVAATLRPVAEYPDTSQAGTAAAQVIRETRS